mgnify:CR=1 FL=1|jgi:formylglycine-generating enzyme required for sulfatase activity
MGLAWRTVLLACLSVFLLACPRERRAIDAGAPQQIGSGLDAMVKVPAGWFIMGSNSGQKDEKPRRRVYLDEFYIEQVPGDKRGLYEVRACDQLEPA